MAKPECPLCGGTGWRLVDRPDQNERTDGIDQRKKSAPSSASSSGAPKLTWAVPCDCTGPNRATRALARARIPPRYQNCDFDNFDTDLWEGRAEAAAWDRSLTQAKVVVQGFAQNYPAGSETGLLLMGPCGVGKTHLAVAALRQLMQRGHDVLFYDYRDLLKELQASYHPDSQINQNGILGSVLRSEVLLLDDVGVGKPSDWVLEMVGHILNKRYNEARVTLLTTSYLDRAEQPREPAQLPSGQFIVPQGKETLSSRIGERVRSRLYEMCRTIEIESADYRREIRRADRIRS
jgi:DNA replication protein DnaC